MSLVDDFYEVAKLQNIDTSKIYKQKNENSTLIMFNEEMESSSIYRVAVLFYDDNDLVEIFVRKKIDNKDLFEILEKINELNSKYLGISFVINEDILSLKTFCNVDNDISLFVAKMINSLTIANNEFIAF